MPLEVRPSTVEPDRPPSDRADRVADRARERDRDVRRKSLVDRASEERDVLVGERTRRESARVDHHELARGREHRVDEHEAEDGVEAVVPDRRRDGVGEPAQDGGDEHARTVLAGLASP